MKKKNIGMIPIFIPHVGCPHICIFCNQQRIALGQREAVTALPEIAATAPVTAESVRRTIDEYTTSGGDNKVWEVAFYGGTFTSIPRKMQQSLLTPAKEALDCGRIQHIRCSTRPDAIDEEGLDVLEEYGVDTVELGVQSLDNTVLEAAKRGHSAESVLKAVELLRSRNFKIGLQFMPGLPNDNWNTVVATTVEAARLRPDFVRIYPVLVIDDTELADAYRSGKYEPLSMEKALEYSAFMKTYFEERDIDVIRTGLQATEEFDQGDSVLAGPYSPAFGEETVNLQILERLKNAVDVLQSIYGEAVNTEENICSSGKTEKYIHIRYPRAMTSKVRGLKKRNMHAMEKLYGNEFIWSEALLPSEQIEVILGSTTIVI